MGSITDNGLDQVAKTEKSSIISEEEKFPGNPPSMVVFPRQMIDLPPLKLEAEESSEDMSPHNLWQELLLAGGSEAPKSVHEVIAHLACHIFRWNDRIFSKFIFGSADEIESKFVNRTTNEDLNLLGSFHSRLALGYDEIRLTRNMERVYRLEISRVKRSLHIRDEIVFELLRHLRGTAEKSILEGIKMSTREKLEDLEAIRERIFAIQFILQDAIHASMQDDGTNVTHNIGILGVVGLLISLIIGAFGANLDGIPGTTNNPHAFKIFCGILIFIGVALSVFGIRYYGLKGRRRR